MSYQVLARKWRPRTFREMVGQEHVLKALINALDHGRLHHAYLFTGTRGVGKTTIARILAKSLNCEVGISSEPCGQCSACNEIDEGRFVDLIEVDAASRTKVEDTREILDNVQYAPTRGRYKVYLIDEVHMLSGHSFNALLKTLEEPPEHVKFLLATTDPQKLPITILSRCLQFSLKAMSPERVVGHLKNVLEKEMVPFEEPALWALGRAADGSMRDAMSLTDQAISFGGGKVVEQDVRAMLGSIDREYVYQLLTCLLEQNGEQLLATIAQMAEQSPDYAGVLADLITALHRIAMAQVAPDAVDDSDGSRAQVLEMAGGFTAEEIQLYYQTALLGRRDLPLAPDARSGFEMVLLRMLLFRPQGVVGDGVADAGQQGGTPVKKPFNAAPTGPSQGSVSTSNVSAQPPAEQHLQNNTGTAKSALDQIKHQLAGDAKPKLKATVSESSSTPEPAKLHKPDNLESSKMAVNSPETAATTSPPRQTPIVKAPPDTASPVAEGASAVPVKAGEFKTGQQEAPSKPAVVKPLEKFDDEWADLLSGMSLNGSVLNFARNCCLENKADDLYELSIGARHELLLQPQQVTRLEEALSEKYQKAIKLKVSVGQPSKPTPDELISKRRQQRLQQAESTLMDDPFVQLMIDRFGASLDKETLQPLDEQE